MIAADSLLLGGCVLGGKQLQYVGLAAAHPLGRRRHSCVARGEPAKLAVEEHTASSAGFSCLQIWASPSIAKIPEEVRAVAFLPDLESVVGARRSLDREFFDRTQDP